VSTEAVLSPDRLRAAFGHFATGVTVVTAVARDGRRHGATANAVSSVSMAPPLLLVCLTDTSRTLGALLETEHFAVNVLRGDQEALARRFARSGSSWDGVGHRCGRAAAVPLLDDVVATLECRVHDVADGGDHRIVVGRVLGVEHTSRRASPLLFYRSSFTTLANGS
jgi:3-hydroxy-9,10-secoandrosta-1,3,5(10)-triene-9,17-dione monooxygenase reductase component